MHDVIVHYGPRQKIPKVVRGGMCPRCGWLPAIIYDFEPPAVEFVQTFQGTRHPIRVGAQPYGVIWFVCPSCHQEWKEACDVVEEWSRKPVVRQRKKPL